MDAQIDGGQEDPTGKSGEHSDCSHLAEIILFSEPRAMSGT